MLADIGAPPRAPVQVQSGMPRYGLVLCGSVAACQADLAPLGCGNQIDQEAKFVKLGEWGKGSMAEALDVKV